MKQFKWSIPVLFVAALFLAACSQDAQPAANVPSAPGFSFSVDPAVGSVELDKLSSELAIAAPAECDNGTRTLTLGNELKLSDYTFAFLPGNMLKITAAFTNTTTNVYEQPFSFSGTSSNVVSTTEPEVTDADLGGDGKLSPKETTAVLTFEIEHKGQAFTYGVAAEADVKCGDESPPPPPPAVCTDPVSIPDANLEEAIRSELEKPEGDITCADMESLTGLSNFFLDNVNNLEGLQYAVNLTSLSMFNGSGQIDDLTPLSNLTGLQTLNLSSNQISDISALSNLTDLQALNLSSNQISDISALVDNAGIGTNDYVNLSSNCLVSDKAQQDVQTLQARGANVYSDNQGGAQCPV